MTASSRGTAVAFAAALTLFTFGRPADAQQPDLPSRPGSSTTDSVAGYVAEASQRFGIPAAWIRAVMRIESAGEVGVTSPAGAMGLMQVMPQTYATLRAKLDLGANAYDPHDNIMAGTAFLRDMHDRYGDAGFLAAYNAGPGRYEEFRAGGRRLPSETILYTARLGSLLGLDGDALPVAGLPSALARPEDAPIFVPLNGDVAPSDPQRGATPTRQVAAADVQVDERAAGLFASRVMSSERTSAADEHAPQSALPMQSSSAASARPEQPVGHHDGLFVQRGAGRPTP